MQNGPFSHPDKFLAWKQQVLVGFCSCYNKGRAGKKKKKKVVW